MPAPKPFDTTPATAATALQTSAQPSAEPLPSVQRVSDPSTEPSPLVQRVSDPSTEPLPTIRRVGDPEPVDVAVDQRPGTTAPAQRAVYTAPDPTVLPQDEFTGKGGDFVMGADGVRRPADTEAAAPATAQPTPPAAA